MSARLHWDFLAPQTTLYWLQPPDTSTYNCRHRRRSTTAAAPQPGLWHCSNRTALCVRTASCGRSPSAAASRQTHHTASCGGQHWDPSLLVRMLIVECSGSCAVMTLGRGDMVHPSSLGLPRATGYSRSVPTSRHQHLVCTDAGHSRPQRRSQGSGTAQTAQHRTSTTRSASTSSAQTQVKRGRGVAARALAAFKPHSIVRRHGIVRQITFSRGNRGRLIAWHRVV